MAEVIVTASEMKQIERAAFDDGIDAEILMDQAGEGIANAVLEQEPQPGLCVAYLGKGNNAGDAIVVGAAGQHQGAGTGVSHGPCLPLLVDSVYRLW